MSVQLLWCFFKVLLFVLKLLIKYVSKSVKYVAKKGIGIMEAENVRIVTKPAGI